MQSSLLFHHISTKAKDYEKARNLHIGYHHDDGM